MTRTGSMKRWSTPARSSRGGPPPTAIPSIDEPRFVRAEDARFIHDREPVVVVEAAGETRAYPIQILTWHEIVNDTIAGVPVAVTYCPLCNSAIAFDARLGEPSPRVRDLRGLYGSAMVMYDRQTESLWTHYDGTAVLGELLGAELTRLATATVGWADFRSAHPGRSGSDPRDRSPSPIWHQPL